METTKEVLAYLKPDGLGVHNGLPIEHYCYNGVLVCEHGKSKQLDEKMDQPIANKIHGSHEGTVISGR